MKSILIYADPNLVNTTTVLNIPFNRLDTVNVIILIKGLTICCLTGLIIALIAYLTDNHLSQKHQANTNNCTHHSI